AKEYYVNSDNKLSSGTAVLVPIIIVIENCLFEYRVIDFQNPLKYNEGDPELEKMFPESILDMINSGKYNDNDSVNKLKLDVKNQANFYYRENE
ncbi:MAG TPA: hypothetical protein VN426_04835, partial [Syntrophomonadaceae bacterium]|nr:hypothetical protein [Syntrophomonadaceae bacterium]